MKQICKLLKITSFAIILTILCTISVKAGVYGFTEAVPILKGWKSLPTQTKDTTSTMTGVILTRKDVDAVQFQARGKNAYGTWNEWGGITLVTAINQNCVVYLDQNYGTGSILELRFRDNKAGFGSNVIIGTWQYF